MTGQAWIRGMGQLSLAFPRREETPEEISARGNLYREMLSELSDEQFLYAVHEIIRADDWFPTIARILSVGFEYRPQVAGYITEGEEPEELGREQRNALAREWLEKIAKQADGEIPLEPTPETVKAIRSELTPEEWDMRRKELLQQADEMLGPGEYR